MPFTPEQKTSLELVFSKPMVQQSFDTTDPREVEDQIAQAIYYLESLYDNFVQTQVTSLQTALVWHIINTLKLKVKKQEYSSQISDELAGIIRDLEGLYFLMRV